MKQIFLILLLVNFGKSAFASELLLTPDNAEEHGYMIRCCIVPSETNREATTESLPDRVVVRLGRISLDENTARPATAISLVVRNNDVVQLSVPLVAEADSVQDLRAEFSARREDRRCDWFSIHKATRASEP